jgi:hypothetical protein
MKRMFRLLPLVFCITVGAPFAVCDSALFSSSPSNSGDGSHPLSASALFSLLGNELTIQLTNSSPAGKQLIGGEVLTGLYFSSQSLNLTPLRTVNRPGFSSIWRAAGLDCPGGCDPGNSWQFQSFNFQSFNSGQNEANSGHNEAGISAVGSFQPSNFGGAASEFDGADHSILPGGGSLDATTQAPYAGNPMTFTLAVPATFSMAYVDPVAPVWYTYDPPSPFQAEAPEPGTWLLIAGALAGLGAMKLAGGVRRNARRPGGNVC